MTNLFRLAFVLSAAPDHELYSGIAANKSELRELGEILTTQGAKVRLQTLTIDLQVRYTTDFELVFWG